VNDDGWKHPDLGTQPLYGDHEDRSFGGHVKENVSMFLAILPFAAGFLSLLAVPGLAFFAVAALTHSYEFAMGAIVVGFVLWMPFGMAIMDWAAERP
jgi:hypothetical protein